MARAVLQPPRPRLLTLTDSTEFGGAERYLRLLLEAARRDGFAGAVAAPDAPGLCGWFNCLAALGCEIIRYDPDRPDLDDLARRTRRWAPTVVHANGSWRPGFADLLDAAAGDAPALLTEHAYPGALTRRVGPWGLAQALRRRPRWREKHRQWRRVARVITVNRLFRRLLGAHWLAPRRKIVSIYNGVDTGVYRPRPDARRRLRQRLGAPDAAPLVVGAGRMDAQKGAPVLLEALDRLRDKPWRAVWFGDGPLREPLERRRRDMGLADRFDLPGHRDDLEYLLPGADVFVLPSSATEALGYSLLEAMACGVAAVATDVGGPAEVLDHGRYGKLAPPKDPVALAEAIGDLLQDPADRAALAQRGRSRLQRRFSRRRMISQTFEQYRAVSWAA